MTHAGGWQLLECTGMDAITLRPAAGEHGEMTGLLMVRAHHQSKGNARKKILIPDTAHGTNPATAAMVNYAVENLKSDSRGMVDISARRLRGPQSGGSHRVG